MKLICVHCGNAFEAKKANAKYCSNAHRVAAQRRPLSGTGAPTNQPTVMKSTPIPTPAGMDFGTQMIFDMLKKESTRFEEAYNKEREAKEKLQDKNNELEKQLLTQKHESEKTQLVNAKPSGLQGFVENNPTIIEKALEHLGPHFGKALGKLLSPGPEFPQGEAIVNWLLAQSDQVKIDFFNLVKGLSEMPPDKLAEKIAEITRSMMATLPQAQQQPSKRVGVGLGR